MRKLIAFDDDTFDKLTQLGRDRMATIQELADEAFADVLKKHGIPIDLKDALRKSAALEDRSAGEDEEPGPVSRKQSPDEALADLLQTVFESRPVDGVEFRGTAHRRHLLRRKGADHARRRPDDQGVFGKFLALGDD